MPPPPHQKPENVLKRAQELLGVDKVPAALNLLHDHVISRRSRNVPLVSLEPVMLLLVELSVDQKKAKLAKDALYQYKNISQNTNIGTIELVLKKFIELASAKVTAAQKKADEVQSSIDATQAGAVDDLEATETPESILLAIVSGEQSRDRTDRAIVTPWLKFLWEAYRTVLDILRNNARLELLYQSTAMQAFDFCLKYARKTEFRRLCELLRNHVQTAAKSSSQMYSINLSDPDTLQRHLETRFQQLNVAVELELWQEAFRSVEDIHTLLTLSKRPAKNVMMANYYEKLTRIFLVGENYLFHAAAWARYYNLLRQSVAVVASGQGKKSDNPPTSEADLQRAASFVVLSALSIPVISTTRSRGAVVDFDEAKKNKNTRLTHLLGMNNAPTRAGLFRDALSKSVLRRARPEIRQLYRILEVDFHPLSICKKISPILVKIGGDADMKKYMQPLQQVILTRLFQQLSQVYDTVSIDFVESLANFPEPFQADRATVEKFIMNGNKKGDLSLRLDHATGVISFDADVFASSRPGQSGSSASGSADQEGRSVQRLQSTPAEIVKSTLTRLSKSLFITCYYVSSSLNEQRVAARDEALQRAKEGAEAEHQALLGRKTIIEKRKEDALELQAQREKEIAQQKRLREQELKAKEDQRIARELAEREERRRKNEHDRVRQEEFQKQMAELNLGTNFNPKDLVDFEDMDSNRLRAYKLEQLTKEKNKVNEKLRIAGKRLDHMERAMRKEEASKLDADYQAQRAKDLAAYERKKAEDLKEAQEKHAESVRLKHRLERIYPYFKEYRDQLHASRREAFEKRRREAERELERQIANRKKEYREAKLREKRQREEQERILREQEEQAAREKEEAKAREEQKRAEMQRKKEEREREHQEALERSALQARREDEAIARRRAEKEKAAEVAAPAASSERRILNLPGASKWREKQSTRTPETPASQPAATRPEASRASSGTRPVLNLTEAKPLWRKDAAKAQPPPPAPPARRETPRIISGEPSGPPVRRPADSSAPPVRREAASSGAGEPTGSIAPPLFAIKPGGWRAREAAKSSKATETPADGSK